MPNRERRKSVVDIIAKVPVNRGSLIKSLEDLLKTIELSESSVMIPTLLRDKCQFNAWELLFVAKILKASILGHSDLVEFYMNHQQQQLQQQQQQQPQSSSKTPTQDYGQASPSANFQSLNGILDASNSCHSLTSIGSSSSNANTSGPAALNGSDDINLGLNLNFNSNYNTNMRPTTINGTSNQTNGSNYPNGNLLANQSAIRPETLIASPTGDSLLITATATPASSVSTTPTNGRSTPHGSEAASVLKSSRSAGCLTRTNSSPSSPRVRSATPVTPVSELPVGVAVGAELAASGQSPEQSAPVKLLLQIEQLKSSISLVKCQLESVVELYKKSIDNIAIA